MSDPPLLDVRALATVLRTEDGPVPVVDGVSLSIRRGETLAVVGESGCGKSMLALSLLRLVDPPLAIAGGEVRLDGDDLLALPEARMRSVRGRRIAMVFQEPMTALNPVLTVGEQVDEVIVRHEKASRREARRRTVALFEEVGIPDPARRVDEYPHQLSGGLRQRVVLAIALACGPSLLIADEPTTALDVTIQAQVLDLLRRLQAEREMAVLLITHDLGVVAEVAHRVAVMYAGRIVEEAPVRTLFEAPAHPYTRALFRSMPSVERGRGRLEAIRGTVPAPADWPPGCRFHPRCGEARPECATDVPPLRPWAERAETRVACFARDAADAEAPR